MANQAVGPGPNGSPTNQTMSLRVNSLAKQVTVSVLSSILLKTGLLSPLKLYAEPLCSLAVQLSITVKAGEHTATFYIENGSAPPKNIEFSPKTKNAANKAQGKSAEWIVEQADGITLSKFDSIIFTDAGAITSSGREVKVSGATIANLKMENQPVLATGSLPGNDQVKITYNGS